MSTDPLVATLFAIKQRSKGRDAVVYIAQGDDVADIGIGEPNTLAELESEVALILSPLEFEQRASVSITADQARDILQGMGFTLPMRISSQGQLTEWLKETPRLNQQQIAEFVLKAEQLGDTP